jgi:hypothetical protein
VIPESIQRFFTTGFFVSELGIACLSGLGVLVLGWLIVSFMAPGRIRKPIEWIAALGLYIALLSFFFYHAREAWQGDHLIRLAAFGLLAALFGSGTLVAVVRFAKSLGSSASESGGATN